MFSIHSFAIKYCGRLVAHEGREGFRGSRWMNISYKAPTNTESACVQYNEVLYNIMQSVRIV